MRRADDGQPAAVGRPGELLDAARQVGQPARLARSIEGQEVDLGAVFAVLGRRRLVLDGQPAVGQEGQAAPVGREARGRVVPAADASAARPAREPSNGADQIAWR